MEKYIELDNEYYLKIMNNKEKNKERSIDIINFSTNEIKNKSVLTLRINFRTFNEKEYKKLLRKLLKVKTKILHQKVKIGEEEDNKIIIGYVLNYDENNIFHKDFINGINAIFYDKCYNRYNYIYDTVCNYLDSHFYGKNLCDFQNNKCGEKRNAKSLTGCCHHFRIKCLGPLTKLVLCEYLNKENYTCDAKCIGCKLFTCDYLERKGVKFRIKDILLLDTFFNPIQKYFIKYKVFTPKEKILKILMATRI